MPKFTDTDHFLDRMAAAEAAARQGCADLAQDYEQLEVPSPTGGTRDPSLERLARVLRLKWFEDILAAAFIECTPNHVRLWWLMRAKRLTRNQAAKHPACPYSRKFMQSGRCHARLAELDQLLLDELAGRKLLTYSENNDGAR